MPKVNVTELRQNLPSYLAKVQKGKEIEVTSHGRIIARVVPAGDFLDEARARLLAARKRCRIGDVVNPSGLEWSAERDRS